jgi:4-hydroxy-tetrahydrodipicolinate reductase
MKVVVIGAGKMGTEIARLAEKQGDSVIAFISSVMQRDERISLLKNADVAIEFTRPEAALDNIKLCLEVGVPVVSGTTGWLAQLQDAQAYCTLSGGALLHASNFSIGVHVFFEMNRRLAAIMQKIPAYDVSVEEIHHTAKLDMPSGTAIVLADDIITFQNRKTRWTLNPEHYKDDTLLPVFAHRQKDVPGTHKVIYSSDADEITLLHEAKNRTGFAAGALMAASWLKNRKGFFTMRDVLNDLVFHSEELQEGK